MLCFSLPLSLSCALLLVFSISLSSFAMHIPQSLFMFPFSPSSSTLSSLPPTLDTISELDLLSDISEDEPDLLPQPDPEDSGSFPAFACAVDGGQPVSSPLPEDPPLPPRRSLPQLALSLLCFCKALRLPSLLDEDGFISLPCLPEDCAALLLPAGLHRHLPPSLLPSFLLLFAVLLSACQSVVLSLLLALPLALSLCYLEPKAYVLFRPPAVTAELTSPEEIQCDPAA